MKPKGFITVIVLALVFTGVACLAVRESRQDSEVPVTMPDQPEPKVEKSAKAVDQAATISPELEVEAPAEVVNQTAVTPPKPKVEVPESSRQGTVEKQPVEEQVKEENEKETEAAAAKVASNQPDSAEQGKVAAQTAVTPPEPKIEAPAKKESEEALPGVALITTTRACACALRRCRRGQDVVGETIKLFPGKVNYKVIDYATEMEEANKLRKECNSRATPAVLFFDSEGKFKGKIEGFLNREKILNGLSSFLGLSR